uniref:Uncharacterized protein n=1 Tax=Entomoneis paludosa TaxID=265537 RepID=A0A7S2Y9A8_9STRA
MMMMMMIKSFFLGLLLLTGLSFSWSFSPISVVGRGQRSHPTILFNKKYPAGKPNTDQVDEDMAMWFEDKQGNAKKALPKPVGGRPVQLYTKQQVQEIEKKGVDPLEKLKAFGKFLTQKPQAGDKWLQ